MVQIGQRAEKVDEGVLREIDGLQLNDRLARLRETFFECKIGVGSERAVLAMESWKETEGLPIETRHAKKLEKIVRGVPIAIHPGQLVVGASTKYFRGANPHIDYDGSYLPDLMAEGRITLGGPMVEGGFTPEDWQALAEAARFFKGKTAADAVFRERTALVGSWYQDLVDAGGVQRYEAMNTAVPGIPYYHELLAKGLRGIIEEIGQRIQRFKDNREDDPEKLDFWQAAIIACEATIHLSRRYAQLAREMAAKETDSVRQAELEEIARVCDWAPENPARTLQEAVQSVVMFDVATSLSDACTGNPSQGLVDQYLYPYFKRDLAEGRVTLEAAANLIGEFLTYLARRERVTAMSWREYTQKGPFANAALGGLASDGRDASNELTYLFLHMLGLVRYAEPHVPVRWHKGTPQWLMLKAVETNLRVKGGVPQFQNSDHIVNYLTDRGVSLEAARLWQGLGCSQADALGTSTMVPSYLNVALAVDLALHNGVASGTGKRVGPETGEPRHFATFEQLFEAFKKQFGFFTRQALWCDNLADRIKGEMWRTPLRCALQPSCREKGIDSARGGLEHYGICLKKDRGIIPAADSLMAVKKLVFEEKRLTMSELVAALDSNFEGPRGEQIRQMCLAAPKYGNDSDEADFMVRDVAKFTASVIFSEKNIFGQPFAINRNGQGWHFSSGKKMGALPNGRKAREPLTDGSLSPTQGVDTRGPTAVLKSALKADFKESEGGILSLRFPSLLFQSPETRGKLVDFTTSFLGEGGTYIQYNLLDREELLEAKQHPERYKDLVVRVGGYSAYFVTLSPEIQDEIIRRTEQSL